MRSIKPGRGPSAMGAIGGIVAVLFGIFWTIMAYSITRNAPGLIATVFPLFGVLFVVIGIIGVVYNLYNTTNKNRLSTFDITTGSEEPDPLNEIFGEKQSGPIQGDTVESKLRELEALRGKGLISEAEYASQRQRILDSI